MKPSTGAAVRDHRNVFQSEQVSAIVGIRNSVRAELKGAAWLKKARIRECGRREKQHRCRRDDAEPQLSCHTSLFQLLLAPAAWLPCALDRRLASASVSRKAIIAILSKTRAIARMALLPVGCCAIVADIWALRVGYWFLSWVAVVSVSSNGVDNPYPLHRSGGLGLGLAAAPARRRSGGAGKVLRHAPRLAR